jgi:hypothetical protein
LVGGLSPFHSGSPPPDGPTDSTDFNRSPSVPMSSTPKQLLDRSGAIRARVGSFHGRIWQPRANHDPGTRRRQRFTSAVLPGTNHSSPGSSPFPRERQLHSLQIALKEIYPTERNDLSTNRGIFPKSTLTPRPRFSRTRMTQRRNANSRTITGCGSADIIRSAGPPPRAGRFPGESVGCSLWWMQGFP